MTRVCMLKQACSVWVGCTASRTAQDTGDASRTAQDTGDEAEPWQCGVSRIVDLQCPLRVVPMQGQGPVRAGYHAESIVCSGTSIPLMPLSPAKACQAEVMLTAADACATYAAVCSLVSLSKSSPQQAMHVTLLAHSTLQEAHHSRPAQAGCMCMSRMLVTHFT